jgi:NADP-dependent 3-hydroxy acid dehydrogenase YdfG
MARAGAGSLRAERLETSGRSVVLVRPAMEFRQLGERSYELDPNDGNAWDALLANLGGAPERIVHLWTLGLEEGLEICEEAQTLGFHSLVALAQALGRQRLSGPVEICVVSDGLCAVEKGDLPVAQKAILLGPVKVIPLEYPGVVCRAVDVDGQAADGMWIERLLAELDGRAVDPVVAWRGPLRWVPDIEPVRLEAMAERTVRLREGGVYLITGGLGGLGLALARFLARTLGARLVLTGRSSLPERSEWSRCIREGGDLARKIREITDLEAMGAEVLALSADVADEESMRGAVARIDERFGRLDGVFQAAGLPGGGLVQLKTPAMAEAVLAPKVRGTLVLESVLHDRRLDFLVLFSSIAWLRGEIGQVDYCAANAFLGAFAQRNYLRGGTPTLTIDWCQWQWDRWTEASAPLSPGIQQELSRRRQTFGLTFDEGMEALVRCLDSGLPQVLVSTQDLRASSSQPSINDVLEELERAHSHHESLHPRPVLGISYIAPAEGLESDLTAIWEALLGIQPIGVHDNFFDLGGHSLLGIQLISRVRDCFGVDLPLRILFEAPTISEMVAAIAQDQGAAVVSTPPEIQGTWGGSAGLLENLDRLSDAEVDGLLSEMLSRKEDGGGLA